MNSNSRLKSVDYKWFPLAILLVYVPFHLLEEALGNFPLWMFEHYGLPKPLSYPHWLINNLAFAAILFTGLLIFWKNKTKNLAFGVGITIWALMNSLEHIIFSILDSKASPGLLTGLVFFALAALSFTKLRSIGSLNLKLISKSLLIALTYWILAFVIIISLGKTLLEIFP